MKIESPYFHVDLVTQGSPKGHDIVFTSTDSKGTPGELNQFVLEELGYQVSDIPKDFSDGFAILEKQGKPTVIFIVTIDKEKGSSGVVLYENLNYVINFYGGSWEDSIIWLPLLGTGTAGLTPIKSWEAIYKVLSKRKFRGVTVSLPKQIPADEKKQIESHIQSWNEIYGDDNELKKLINSRSFYLVGHHWGDQNKLDEFIKESRWENGHDGQFIDEIDAVEKGDVLLAKSSWAKPGQSQLSIYAVGVVSRNLKDGHNLSVNWRHFDRRIDLTKGAHYRAAFHKVHDDYLQDIISGIVTQVPSLFKIIEILRHGQDEISPLSLKNRIVSGSNHWWLQARTDRWEIDSLEVGQSEPYGKLDSSSKVQRYFNDLQVGDLVVGYQAGAKCIKGLFEIDRIDVNEAVFFKKLYKFEKQTSLEELRNIKAFSEHTINKTRVGSFHKLDRGLFQEIINTTELGFSNKPTSKKQNQSRIAGLSHDAIDGEDYLGIEKDVTSFAKVIASNSFTPPLAIALFGQWGTGKSFFMKKLMKRIDGLSNSGNDYYRAGIAQIHFNAWSYLDTNLFASIVAEVFEKLDEYISGNKKSDVRIKSIENELTDKLSVAGKQRELLREKKESHIKNIRGLRKKILDLKKDSEDKIIEIKSNNSQKIFEEVEKKLNVKSKLNDAVSQLSIKSEELGEINPDSLLTELKSGQNFIRESINLARKDRRGIGILVLLIVVAIGLSFIPTVSSLELAIPQTIAAIIAPIPIIWKSVKGTIDLLTPVITKVNSIRDQQEKLTKEIQSKYEQEVEAAKLEIEIKNQEVVSFQDEILALEADYNKINYLLKHNLKQHAVYSFISERSKSEEYQKYLGVVSTIRKDFEILSDLFDQSNKEGQKFRDHFERPLERIVLYIDDLDRCKEDQVIQVLEAVNLLMAFPLFIVVVGVDPRWVKNALIKEYHMQFSRVEDKKEMGIEPIEASNYLEKIFQVPFHLEEAQDESVKEMIKNLGTSSIAEVIEEEESSNTPPDKAPKQESSKSKAVSVKDKVSKTVKEMPPKKESELLSLSDIEVELLQEMSGIIGTNPRGIKRFVNVYQIVRAHEGLGTTPGTDEEYLVLMILLALPVGGYRPLYKEALKLPPNEFKTLGDFLMYMAESAEDDLGAKSLSDYLEKSSNKELIYGLKLEALIKQNEFIKRFTFSELA